MKPLFSYQPQLNYDAPTDYLDTALVELISQFSFAAFYNPYFGNGRLFAKLPKRNCHGAFISDSNPKVIELLNLVKSDATNEQIHRLCNELGGSTPTNELIVQWSRRLQNTNINLQSGAVATHLDPSDLLFVQPPDTYKQDTVTRLLPELTDKNHNWLLVVANSKGNKQRYNQYKLFEVLGDHWLIVYNMNQS